MRCLAFYASLTHSNRFTSFNILVLEQERHERKHSDEVVAHSNRQMKSLLEKLAEKEEESKRIDVALEQLKKCR